MLAVVRPYVQAAPKQVSDRYNVVFDSLFLHFSHFRFIVGVLFLIGDLFEDFPGFLFRPIRVTSGEGLANDIV